MTASKVARLAYQMPRLKAVSLPRRGYITLPFHEVLKIAEEERGPLQHQDKIKLAQTFSKGFPVKISRQEISLDLSAIRDKRGLVEFPIKFEDLHQELRELEKSQKLYEGKRLHHDLLIITKLSPDYIKIEQNPNYRASPENIIITTAQNLERKVKTLTDGIPDDSIKDIVEAYDKGDLDGILKILAQEHPEEVKKALAKHDFDQILIRQDRNCLLEILYLLSSSLLQTSATEREKLKIIKNLKKYIHKSLGLSLEDFHRIYVQKTIGKLNQTDLNKLASLDEAKLRGSLLPLFSAHKKNLLKILLPSDMDAIAKTISEARRSKIIEQVRKSNLLKNVKLPLLHILAEKEYAYVSEFSFTDPLYAAALLSSWLRGSEIKILFDQKESNQSSSQYKALVNHAQALSEKYSNLPNFEIRVFSGVQHQKNILLGSSRTIIMGSQNLSKRAFIYNLEDNVIIQNDRENFETKRMEFDKLFAVSGSFVPFSEEILAKHEIKRAGWIGLKFDKPPSHPEASEILKAISRLKVADIRRAKNILEIVRGGEVVVDLSSSFQPFLAEIKNPMIVHFLTRFFENVPLGFTISPASSGGRLHPGTTSGLSGLIEHEYIAAEIAIKLCKILGREDLIDQALLAILVHDTYKNAWINEDGTIAWRGYNPSHGHLASQKSKETYADLHPGDKTVLKDILPDVDQAVGAHMSIFNKPESTPLNPSDPLLKFIVVLADMLASRKYFYVKHRARLHLERDELLHLLLNNSFSIEGEALDLLKNDLKLFRFIAQSAREAGYKIEPYQNLPARTKKMLRVAESLCDLFPASKEVIIKKGKRLTGEEKKRITRRNEILSATLLYSILRYKHGLRDPKSKIVFDKLMEKLCQIYPDSNSRQRKILNLMLEADRRLAASNRANLFPKDNPDLWILGMANCMMTAEDIWIVTIDEVEQYLSKAEEPKTKWDKGEFDPALENQLFSGIKSLAFKDYFHEFLPMVEEGLLLRLNFRRKRPLSKIHPDILSALIRKYDCLFPSYIYDQFYRPLTSHFRKKMIEKIRAASKSDKNLHQLIEEIKKLPDPKEPPPTRVFKMAAQTALVNGINSINKLGEVIQAARDTQNISDYSYFKQIGPAVEHVFAKIADPEEKIKIYGDYDVDGQTGAALLVKTLRWMKAKILSQTMDRKKAQKIAEETITYRIPNRLTEGYSLNAWALEQIHAEGNKTIITVDCGIKDRALIKRAKEMGMDIIVTDHHEPEAKELPEDAVAILNPKLDLSPDHPAHYLCGAAVAYKFARALVDKLNKTMAEKWRVERWKIIHIFGKLDRSWEAYFSNPQENHLQFKPNIEEKIKSVSMDQDKKRKLLALLQDSFKAGINFRDSFLDSVALATVADVVPMIGENRALVRAGLKRLNSRKKNKGLAAIQKAFRLEYIDEEALAYYFAPLINVIERLGKHHQGVEILMASSEKEARRRASSSIPYLEDRREIEQEVFKEAEKSLEEKYKFDSEKDAGIAVAGEWHKGIIGIVASKLVAKYGVPTVVIGTEPPSQFAAEEPAYGSMRTIKGVNAIEILNECAEQYKAETGEELFLRYGGHKDAAGFKIEKEKISDFIRIYREITKTAVTDKRQRMIIAGPLYEGEITLEEVKLFKKLLSPFGNGFEEPRFLVDADIKRWQVFGRDQQHIRGNLEKWTPFIFFYGNQPWVKRILMQKEAKLAVKLGINRYKGRENVNLIVEDTKSYKRKKKKS